MEPIYFSKIQFTEYVGHGIHGKSIMLLDLDNRELVYQVLGPEKKAMPEQQGTEFRMKFFLLSRLRLLSVNLCQRTLTHNINILSQ